MRLSIGYLEKGSPALIFTVILYTNLWLQLIPIKIKPEQHFMIVHKKLLLALHAFFLICHICSAQQKHTVSGTVVDNRTGEFLQNASIIVENDKAGTTTNAYGYFSLTLPAGNVQINIRYVGYETENRLVDLTKSNISLGRFGLSPTVSNPLQNVIVTSKKNRLSNLLKSTQMGVVDLPVALLMKVPSILGEPDIIKALQLTPGVKHGGEGTIGMYVRGGGVDENLIILDEATVYNAGHLLGFFSVFNTSALKDVTLYKSSFPAQYGGRLSSIMDVRMKDGNLQNFQADASLGLISSSITFQGPIVKNRTSYIVSSRRTYLDVITGNAVPYHFYDINAKINHIIDGKNRIYLSFYKGDDILAIKKTSTDVGAVSFDLLSGISLGNTIGSLRWNHIFTDPRLFSNISLVYTRFRYNIQGQYTNNSLLIASAISDVGIRSDLSFKPNTSHDIHFGGQAINHFFNPNIVNTSGIISDALKNRPGQKIYNTELGLYANDEYQISDKTSINGGLRVTGDAIPNKFYFNIEPRLATRYLINKTSSLKFSYARMVQYMHLVSSSAIALPTDLWYPVTKKIAPGKSDQVSFGYFKNFPKKNIAFSAETYYKWMGHLIEYKEGAALILNDNYENELVTGKGHSFGIELFVSKTVGRFQGWIGYTLSYAYRKFDSLNNGQRYFSRFDRRHDFSLVGTYALSKKWSVATNIVYSSGSPFTAQTNQYIAPNPTFTNIDILSEYSSRNAYRLSGAARLDLDFTCKLSEKKRLKSELHLGCYNFFNAVQPSRVEQGYNAQTGMLNYTQNGLFGFVPSIAINFHY